VHSNQLIRKVFSLFTVLALLFGTSAHAADPKIINWEVKDLDVIGGSVLSVWKSSSMNFSESICPGNLLRNCPYKDNFQSQTYLPVCMNEIDRSCIEKVAILSGGTVWKDLKWVTDFGSPEVPADPDLGIPRGTSASYWSNESAGDGVILAPAISFAGSTFPLTAYNFNVPLWRASIVRTGTASGMYREFTDANGNSRIGWNFSNCGSYIGGNGYCGNLLPLNVDERYKVTLRVPENLSNWIFGRLGNAEVSQTSLGDGFARVEISANPAKVAQIGGQLDANDSDLTGWGNQMSAGSSVTFMPDKEFTFRAVKVAMKTNEPTAKSEKSVWNFGSIPQSISLSGNKCAGKGIVGVIATDAPIYEPSSPRIVDDELRYQLAGSHLGVDGKLLKANYKLLLSKDVAKCLYPSSAISPKVAVQIIGSSDEENVATFTTHSDSEWVIVNINGLTFSAPEIRIKLETEVKPTPAPTPTVSATPTPNVTKVPVQSTPSPTPKLTPKAISCVKGK
jgi:hypothetical protein